jgi:hypothetical protein
VRCRNVLGGGSGQIVAVEEEGHRDSMDHAA